MIIVKHDFVVLLEDIVCFGKQHPTLICGIGYGFVSLHDIPSAVLFD